ncbi:MAG TPA: tyrosine-type recombinase/integrase [Myxococcaceae bacterium]|nr:tyrosine-type recombinase/integrase [Myxococcaceae bacterium]
MLVFVERRGWRSGCSVRPFDGDLLDRNELQVRRSRCDGDITTPKSGRSRIVPFPSEVASALRPLVGSPERLVFAREDQTPFERFIARAPIERVCRRLEMQPFNIHITRHSDASHLVQRGVPLATVAKLLGQSVLTVTAAMRTSDGATSTMRSACLSAPCSRPGFTRDKSQHKRGPGSGTAREKS